MVRSQLYGMPARYLATPPTLQDGAAVPLLVNVNGALITSSVGVSAQVYTTQNVTPTRTIDASTAATADVAKVLGTLIDDLKAAGILQ